MTTTAEITISDPDDDDDEFVAGAATRKVSLKKKADAAVLPADGAAIAAPASAASRARPPQHSRRPTGRAGGCATSWRTRTKSSGARREALPPLLLPMSGGRWSWRRSVGGAARSASSRMKAQLEAVEAERDGLSERLRDADAARIAAQTSAPGDADAAAAAKAASDEAAAARTEASNAKRLAAAAEASASAEEELRTLKGGSRR